MDKLQANTIQTEESFSPPILERPYVVSLDKSYGTVAPEKKFLKFIKAAANLFKIVGQIIMKLVQRIDGAVQEGADIHNRQVQSTDERYARNWFHIRGGF